MVAPQFTIEGQMLTPEQVAEISLRSARKAELLAEMRADRGAQAEQKHQHVGVEIARALPNKDAQRHALDGLTALADWSQRQGYPQATALFRSLASGIARLLNEQRPNERPPKPQPQPAPTRTPTPVSSSIEAEIARLQAEAQAADAYSPTEPVTVLESTRAPKDRADGLTQLTLLAEAPSEAARALIEQAGFDPDAPDAPTVQFEDDGGPQGGTTPDPFEATYDASDDAPESTEPAPSPEPNDADPRYQSAKARREAKAASQHAPVKSKGV